MLLKKISYLLLLIYLNVMYTFAIDDSALMPSILSRGSYSQSALSNNKGEVVDYYHVGTQKDLVKGLKQILKEMKISIGNERPGKLVTEWLYREGVLKGIWWWKTQYIERTRFIITYNLLSNKMDNYWGFEITYDTYEKPENTELGWRFINSDKDRNIKKNIIRSLGALLENK